MEWRHNIIIIIICHLFLYIYRLLLFHLFFVSLLHFANCFCVSNCQVSMSFLYKMCHDLLSKSWKEETRFVWRLMKTKIIIIGLPCKVSFSNQTTLMRFCAHLQPNHPFDNKKRIRLFLRNVSRLVDYKERFWNVFLFSHFWMNLTNKQINTHQIRAINRFIKLSLAHGHRKKSFNCSNSGPW